MFGGVVKYFLWISLVLVSVLLAGFAAPAIVNVQMPVTEKSVDVKPPTIEKTVEPKVQPKVQLEVTTEVQPEASKDSEKFRSEKIDVAGGSELVTIFGPVQKPAADGSTEMDEVPLVSVLRDTLGDDIPENDKLTKVWLLSHTKPTIAQRLAAFVPFLYTRTSNKNNVGDNNRPSPVLLDLSGTYKKQWDGLIWMGLRKFVIRPSAALIRVPYLIFLKILVTIAAQRSAAL